MPTTAVSPDLSAAQRAAQLCWESNYQALCRTQPRVAAALVDARLDVEWVFARDGSITALENGRWWADCSVPLLAGRSLLKALSDESVSSCQLAPPYAGLVRAARERMGETAVLFVAQPDVRAARMILSCDDFSRDLSRHRFWIVAGPDWLACLEQIFTDFPGLSTPTRFIRTRLAGDELTGPLITKIQDVFSKVLSARGDQIAALRAQPLPAVDAKNILLVGGGEFRLWDFGPQVLERELSMPAQSQPLTIRRFDTDDALCGSPLALLGASRECGCIVSVNVCRADCNQLVAPEIPWVTWMTQPGAPPFETAGPRDALILADERWRSIAKAAGWPAQRVHVCGWPAAEPKQIHHGDTEGTENEKDFRPAHDFSPRSSPSSQCPPCLRLRRAQSSCGENSLHENKKACAIRETRDSSTLDPALASTSEPASGVLPRPSELGLICDTRKIQVPGSVVKFSSQRLLWELIEEELAANPLAVEDVDAYLANRAGQLNITVEALERGRFIDELILPAYQQGLARLLIAAKLPIRLWGRGWGDLPEFVPRVAGAILNRDEFEQAIAGCCGLIYCWPSRGAHPIEMTGKRIVYRTGMDRAALIRAARSVAGSLEVKAASMGERNQLGKLILRLSGAEGN